MLIRTAAQADLPALTDIYNDEVLSGVATLDLQPKALEDRQVWLDTHNVGNHPLLVAEVDGVVAGYASLSPYREKEAYCSTVELSVYVARSHRRMGVASAPMEEILRLAREDPRTHLVVSVSTSGNTASERLHERFGFTFCGHIPEVGVKFSRYLGIDNYYLVVAS